MRSTQQNGSQKQLNEDEPETQEFNILMKRLFNENNIIVRKTGKKAGIHPKTVQAVINDNDAIIYMENSLSRTDRGCRVGENKIIYAPKIR